MQSGCTAGFPAQPPWQTHDGGTWVTPAVTDAVVTAVSVASVTPVEAGSPASWLAWSP
ncbi:hypothetical protein ACX80S_13065 [Arthrobacter sp. RHLT1-20]